MSLKNIIEGYKLTERFVSIMKECEEHEKFWSDVQEGETYLAQRYQSMEIERKERMEGSPSSLVTASVLYLARHPLRMVQAQKFYNQKFGKPCEVNYD